MRSVGGIAAAIALAAAMSIEARQATAEAAPDDGAQARLLFFAGTDLWRHGGFAHSGAQWSPNGLDRDGFALKVMFNGGSYRYVSGALGNTEVRGRQFAGAILPGWRFVSGPQVLTLFAGLDLQDHRLAPDDPAAGLRGRHVGARVALELWYAPTAATMLAADASVSNLGPSYSARISAGLRLFDRCYVGPEVQGFAADDNYQQLRAGLHVSALRIHAVEWAAGLGWATDSDHRASLYARLGMNLRR